MTLNADERESIASAAARLIAVGCSVEQTVERITWSVLVKPVERGEVEAYVRRLLAER